MTIADQPRDELRALWSLTAAMQHIALLDVFSENRPI
jgi:hypothetical protein